MSHPKLGELLIKRQIISEEDLRAALALQKELKARGKNAMLGAVLVHQKRISQESLNAILREQQRSVRSQRQSAIGTKAELIERVGEVNVVLINQKTQKPFVEQMVKEHILVAEDANGLPVLLVSEDARSLYINQLKKTIGALRDAYKDDQNALSRIASPVLVRSEIIKLIVDSETQKQESGSKTDQESQFIQILEMAYEAKATDIHFYRLRESCHVKFRIFGELLQVQEWDVEKADNVVSVAFSSGVGGKASHWKREENQRRRIQHRMNQNVMLDCRYEHAPGDSDTYHAVIRLMPNDKRDLHRVVELESLGFTAAQAKLLRTGVMKASGAVLIAGPTGSGKSTTMASLVKWLNKVNEAKLNILTVESPIERELPAFQVPVNDEDNEGGRDGFAEAIRSTLRRDPDFLMVGEIRDPESAAALVNGVQTGHPVLTTVHAQSALEIVERMAGPGMNVPPQTLGSPSFISVLCYQMLLPRLDDKSKIRVTKDRLKELLGPDLARRILEVCPNVDDANIHIRGDSNPEYPQGVSGMTICAEVVSPDYKMREHFRRLEITEALAHWRRAGEQHRRQQSRDLDRQVVGFSALDHAISKMVKGMIDPRDVELYFGMINMQNVMRDGIFEEDEADTLFELNEAPSAEEHYEGFIAEDADHSIPETLQ